MFSKEVSTLVKQLISHIFESLDLALTVYIGNVDIFFTYLFISGSSLNQEVDILRLDFFLGLDDCLDALLLKYALAHLK